MTYNHSGRLTLIGVVLYLALSSLFPHAPGALFWFFNPSNTSLRPDLKPGIDMVGGTSLTYDIKQPEGGYQGDGTLAESVASALKKRVDPLGQRNLVWRPQGNTRLEIQLPRSVDTADAARVRQAFVDAQRAVEATNVREAEVVRAAETLSGAERDKRLAELAGGDPARQALFADVAKAADALKAARAGDDAEAEARAAIAFDKVKAGVEQRNVGVADLQAVMDGPADQRDRRLADLKQNATPQRVAAIDGFAKAHAEFATVKDSLDGAADVKRLLRGSGVLEFHILADPERDPGYAEMVSRLEADGPGRRPGDDTAWFQIDDPEQFGNYAKHEHNGKFYALAWITPERSMVNPPGQRVWSLASASPVNIPGKGRAVGFRFDPVGGNLFGVLTGGNVGRPLSVMLDGRVISSANIDEQINGSGTISRTDGYAEAELRYLLNTLSAGSLPATLADEPISERTVGPQLGADNLRRGLLASVLGLGIVAAFMISYYYAAGVVAAFAVLLNVVLILSTMAAINATFTLPGVAGIVLTIGAAVDANVLIFERLREEQQRGVGIRAAIRNAYSRAAGAIVDSNATTLITSLLLVWLGTEEVKGFGIALLIGLVWSLFTSLYVTRTVFDIMVDKFGVDRLGSLPLSLPKLDRFLKPNVDWMGKAWAFMAFSAVFIVLGCTAFLVKWNEGKLLDVEFAKGTSVQFALKQPMDIERVRERIDRAGLPSPSVVAVGTEETTYEVVTPEENAAVVTKAVLGTMRDGDGSLLDVETPSEFRAAGTSVDDALAGGAVGAAVLPVTGGDFKIGTFAVPGAEAYRNGAAIVLRDISPKRTATELADRIRRQQLQPQAGADAPAYAEFTVVSPAGPAVASDVAVVLVAPGNAPYDPARPEAWKANVAAPMWRLVNDAVRTPADLQSVRSIDPSIAGEARTAALAALVLSVLVIMVYIWLRFGNLKYGTATVLAMAHDTLLAVGAIGLSHYVVQWTPGLASLLLVEPFRLNLTLVAAVLTVMSYSMIDTIVVFDRIRENRGNAPVNRGVVNNSINQTLSRTLLTVGTTVATLLCMYVFGGPGIHGFTFVLLIGILVGTYSSIAIAAPFLLLGAGSEEAGAGNKPAVGQLQRA